MSEDGIKVSASSHDAPASVGLLERIAALEAERDEARQDGERFRFCLERSAAFGWHGRQAWFSYDSLPHGQHILLRGTSLIVLRAAIDQVREAAKK